MKNFFKTVRESFYSSNLYQKAKEESGYKGIKFILKTSLFLGLFLGIVALIMFLIFAGTLKKIAVNFAAKSYPDQLVITIKDGNLTSNTTEPVVIPIPTKKENKDMPKNLTILVPNEKAEPSVLEKYDTFSAITSNGVVLTKGEKKSGQIEIYTFQKVNKIINKDLAMESSYFILHFMKIMIAILIIPMFIFMLLMFCLCQMVFLFFTALIIFLIMKMKKIDITYKQSYKMGLYAIVPLLILGIILFPFNLSGVLFNLVVILGIILYATNNWKKEEVETVKEEAEATHEIIE